MCLVINQSIKSKKPDKDGFCIGWKLIKKDNSSLIQDHFYKVGLNISNRNISIGCKEYSEEEKRSGKIYYGFHLFLNKRGAKRIAEYRKNRYEKHYDPFKLIKIYYKPKDVIAYGTMEYTGDPNEEINETPNVVVNKLTIKSLERVKL